MTCHICGAHLAESVRGLQHHIRLYHGIRDHKPKFRPKKEVVADWEARNARFIIDGNKVKNTKACDESCRCNSCFQAALDRLVSKTEESANDCRTRLSLDNDVASNELSQRSRTNGQYTIQHGYGSQD